MLEIKGRAQTRAEKEKILSRLLECWDKNYELRLGQLLINAIEFNSEPDYTSETVINLFNEEDEDLISKIEKFTVEDPISKTTKE